LTKQEITWWTGQNGKDYTDSNPVDPLTRVSEFKKLIGDLPIKRILEIGCNRGHNLTAISSVGNYELHGIDPCEYAITKAREANHKAVFLVADAFRIPYPDSYFDLVLTSGVLMHISNDDLSQAVGEIYRVRSEFILTIEYGMDPYQPPGIRHNEVWDVALRINNVEFLVYRNYGNVFHGYVADGPTGKEWGNEKMHWWLFRNSK